MQELIPTKQAGTIIPWGDVMEMKKQLVEQLEEKMDWEQWSENAIASSMKFPSHQESTQDWIAMYQHLTGLQS
jgi:hypothetical protein